MKKTSLSFGFRIMVVLVAGSFVLAAGPLTVYGKNQVKTAKAGGGPPAWAPAHGYRRKYQYWPKQKVYFEPEQKKYFWVDAGIVKVGTQLPGWIKISGSGVSTELDSDKPSKGDFK